MSVNPTRLRVILYSSRVLLQGAEDEKNALSSSNNSCLIVILHSSFFILYSSRFLAKEEYRMTRVYDSFH